MRAALRGTKSKVLAHFLFALRCIASGMFPRSGGLKAINKEWHDEREKARRTANTVEEFSPEDIIRYDLDTAGITGRANPHTYKRDVTVDVVGEADTDIRDDPRK